MLKVFIQRILYTSKIIGYRSTIWLGVASFGGVLLAFVEVLIAVFIQLFLKNLGFKIESDSGLFRFLNKDYSISALMIFLTILGILRAISYLTVSLSASIALESINARLRLLSLRDILLSNSGKFISAADTNAKISEIFPKTSQFFYYLAQALPQIIVSLFLVCILFTISIPSAIFSLLGLAAIASLLSFINSIVRKYAQLIPVEQEKIMAGVQRVTRNWLLIRTIRTNQTEFQKISASVISYAAHSIRALELSSLSAAVPQAAGVILLVIIILINTHLLHSPNVQIIAFLYLFLRLVQTCSLVASHFGTLSLYFPHAKMAARFFWKFSSDEIHETTLQTADITSFRFANRHRNPILDSNHIRPVLIEVSAPKIQLSNIRFSYGSEQPIFENFSLDIEAGDQIAITGRSGTGKSTLLAIIFGILKPDLGRVELDGLDAAEYFSRFYSRIGYVGAEPFLIEGTIKDNLDYGSVRNYNSYEYEEALREACLLTVVNSLPNQLNYKIEENGEGLSAGQKQRLAIARALLRKPVLLILDEVTANLDAQTEVEVVASLSRLRKKATLIIISHRPEALRYADVVFNLPDRI